MFANITDAQVLENLTAIYKSILKHAYVMCISILLNLTNKILEQYYKWLFSIFMCADNLSILKQIYINFSWRKKVTLNGMTSIRMIGKNKKVIVQQVPPVQPGEYPCPVILIKTALKIFWFFVKMWVIRFH